MTSNLIAALARIDPKTVPSPTDNSSTEGLQFVGTLPDELIRFYGLRTQKYNDLLALGETQEGLYEEGGEIFELQRAHRERHTQSDFDRKECPAYMKKAGEIYLAARRAAKALEDEYKTIEKVLWQLVRLEFGLVGATHVGIRADWGVFSSETVKEEGPLGDFFYTDGLDDLDDSPFQGALLHELILSQDLPPGFPASAIFGSAPFGKAGFMSPFFGGLFGGRLEESMFGEGPYFLGSLVELRIGSGPPSEEEPSTSGNNDGDGEGATTEASS